MLKIKSSDFDSEIFECVDNALSTLGEHQREFVRLRLKNRHYLPLKNVARAPVTFERSLTESLGTSVSTVVIGHILNNISKTFGIHVASDSTLSLAIENARKTTRMVRVNSNRVDRVARNRSFQRPEPSKRSIHVSLRLANN